MVTNNPTTNDYAGAIQGQAKWFATNAYEELKANLPNGAGSAIESLIAGFTATNNYQALNIGQLKYVAQPFYDRLITEGYCTNYPWTSTTNDDKDYALANIGQLKYVFAFDLLKDTDSDSLPDWWEVKWFGSITNQTGTNDFDGDGLNNLWDFTYNFDPAAGMGTNLMGWWKFDEQTGTNIYDSSGKAHDGYAVNMSPWPTTNGYPSGCALDFDGSNDKVIIANHPDLNPTSGISVAAWVRLDAMGPDGYALIAHKDTAFYLYVYDYGSGAWLNFDVDNQSGSATKSFPYGQWVHVVGTYDGTTVCVYVNGESSSSAYSGSLPTNTYNLSVGYYAPDNSCFWNGPIADLRFYNAALSPSTVSNMYQAAADSDGDGLTNIQEFQNGTNPRNSDTDGDGFSDSQEVQWGSCPTNASSYLTTISGTTTYSGPQTGKVWIVASATSNAWSSIWITNTVSLGAYTITNVPNLTQYWIKAWRDSNGNSAFDSPEACGNYASNSVFFTNSISGIDITLTDPDTDNDALPNYWELQYFGNTNQTGYMDFDNDGINNLDECTGQTNPYDGLSLEAAGKGSATVCWHTPQATGTTSYAYLLTTNGVSGSWQGFGSAVTTNLTLTSLSDWTSCHVIIQATNADAGAVVWTNATDWIQPGNELISWYLFANIPTQSLGGGEAVIMTREFNNVGCTGSWDRFYISSSFTNGAGFSLTGLRFEMETGGSTSTNCDYGWSAASSLDVTGGYQIPEGVTNNVKIHVRYDGTSGIGIDKRLYFIRWNPGVNLSFPE